RPAPHRARCAPRVGIPPPHAGPRGRGQRRAGRARDGGVPARAGRRGGRTVGGDPARVPGGQRSRLTSSAEYVETEYGTRYVSAILPATRAVNIPLTTTSSWLIRKRIVPTTAATTSGQMRGVTTSKKGAHVPFGRRTDTPDRKSVVRERG